MIITGTRKGIGKYLAKYYVGKGYYVVGCSRDDVDFELNCYQHFCLDVSDEASVKKMFSEIRKNYGRLDVLINNAGTASTNHILLTPIKAVKEVMNTNFIGTFLFCREAGKIMKNNSLGRIVNFSTVATQLIPEGEAIYTASKAAVEKLTEALSKEYAEFGITVNTIAPTPVKTSFIQGVSEEKFNSVLEKQTIKRYSEFQDISNVVDFFIQSQSDSVTGQVIYLGGV